MDISDSGTAAGKTVIYQEKLYEALLFIKEMAIRISLPQTAVATAQTFLHRVGGYFIKQLEDPFEHTVLASVCLFLALKSMDRPAPLGKVVKTFSDINREIRMRQNSKLVIPPLSQSKMEQLKARFAQLEIEILSVLGFDVEVDLPYRYIAEYKDAASQGMSSLQVEALFRVAYNFANDSYFTQACVKKSAQDIACACVFLATQYLGIDISVPKSEDETLAIISNLYNTYGIVSKI